MDFKELILLAFSAFSKNRLRSFLTMLGIIIGIASVIIIFTLGQGATSSIIEQVSSLGTNVISVFPGAQRQGRRAVNESATTLTFDDAEAIAQLSNINAVSGIVNTVVTTSYRGKGIVASLYGVDSSYQNIQSLNLNTGSFFTPMQQKGLSKSVVIGSEIANQLFGEGVEPVGETIQINNKGFRVIGVLTSSDTRSFLSPNETVFIPLSTAMKVVMGQDYLNNITVVVADVDLMDSTIAEIDYLLTTRHKINNPSFKDFSIMGAREMVSTISNVTGMLTTMLSAIAAISLVVGGIGIMNIMLVTVTERTKEIGLLKAIGAKKRDILTQFLIEAVVITLGGGFVGVIMGLSISFIITLGLGIPFIIKLSSILIAVGITSLVGILFGYYPAKNAAGLNPIDALRCE